MNSILFFSRLAWNNLRRGGQRIFVALLCIIFGVMSLVSMTMLSQSIERTMLLKPTQFLGADLSLGRRSEDFILPEHIEQLKQFQQAGEIERFTLLAFDSSPMFHKPLSGEVHFAGSGIGVNPLEYPLASGLELDGAGSSGLAGLLQQPGDVVITRDLADEYDLKPGDGLVLADLSSGAPVSGTVRGVAVDTPNHQGSKIYYTISTAEKLSGGRPVINTALVSSKNPNRVGGLLENEGWQATLSTQVSEQNAATTVLITDGLKGAGILGLLVGGIGIANTMTVLLRRRQREIAIWKTLGYRESDLRYIFSLEAGLLGLVGSLIGAGLGVLVSSQLVELFRRTSNLLFSWSFSPQLPVMGIIVGTFATVIFALWAIILSSQAQPMALLRNEAATSAGLPWWKSAGLGLVLAVPFLAVTSIVMGSLLAGLIALGLILAGVAALAIFFAVLLWIITRILPLGRFPLARTAIKSLRRRGFGLVFAMIALFVGVLSMSLGLVVSQNGQREMSVRAINIEGYNLNLLALADQEKAIRKVVEAQHPEQVGIGYTKALKSARAEGGDLLSSHYSRLIGRSDISGFSLHGAAWNSQPGIYALDVLGLNPGDRVEVTFWDGKTAVLPVIGTYAIRYDPVSPVQDAGLLVPAGSFRNIAAPDTVTYFVKVPANRLNQASASLGQALPQVTVINLVAYALRFIQTYKNLFILAMAMSGLALLAGVLLVANSISLALLDRRYELGVLKTVGYSRWHILAMLGVEYSLVGVIATAAGLGAVRVYLAIMSAANHITGDLIRLTPGMAGVIGLVGVGFTLLTVLLVSWKPTQVSPLVTINERN